MHFLTYLFNLVINFTIFISICDCHGFLQDPPQRGRAENGLMAGVCGGASYMAPGTIQKRYRTGQVITIHSSLTANHLGTIIVGLCASPSSPSQTCFDANRLKVVTGSKDNDFTARIPGYSDPKTHLHNNYYHDVKLPDNFRCNHCVLQWYWFGQNTGELYKNCADISITDDAPAVPNYSGNEESTTTQATTTTTTVITSSSSSRRTPTRFTTTTTTTTTPAPEYYDEYYDVPNIKLICSKSSPPPRTSKTDQYKFTGSAAICFWTDPVNPLDCDLCKYKCLTPQGNCPNSCDCRWYA